MTKVLVLYYSTTATWKNWRKRRLKGPAAFPVLK